MILSVNYDINVIDISLCEGNTFTLIIYLYFALVNRVFPCTKIISRLEVLFQIENLK